MNADPFTFLPGLFMVIWLGMFAVIIGSIILMIWMLVDAVQVPDDRFYRTGTKLVWVLVIVLTGGIGAAIYYFVGRPTPQTRAWIKANPQAARPAPAYGHQSHPPHAGPQQGTSNVPQTGAPQPPPEPPAS